MKFNQIVSVCVLVSSASGNLVASQSDMPTQTPAVTAAQSADVTEWNLVQGVETVGDEGRGDWFKKKKILQQARKVYQELRTAVQHIVEIHGTASAQYTPAIAQLAEKLSALKIQPADVETQLQELTTAIETLAAREKLTDEQRKLLIEQQDTKNMVQQFLVDFKFAHELQDGLQKAATIAATHIQYCQAYEQKAWQLYEAIDAALNDTIAEQMFEEMQTMLENVGLISSYISQDLAGYFQKTLPLLQEQEMKIAEEYARLQDRGIFPKELSEQELQAEQQKTAAAKKVPARSWWQTILSPFVWFWNWIMSFFRK